MSSRSKKHPAQEENIVHQRLRLSLGTQVISETAKTKELAATVPPTLAQYIDNLAQHDYRCSKKLSKVNRLKQKQPRSKGSYMDAKLNEINRQISASSSQATNGQNRKRHESMDYLPSSESAMQGRLS